MIGAPDLYFLYEKIEETVCTCPKRSNSIVIDILSQWDAKATNEIIYDKTYVDILRVSPVAFKAIRDSLVTMLQTLHDNLDCRTIIDDDKSDFGRIRFRVFFNEDKNKKTKKQKTEDDDEDSDSSFVNSCSL